jgi:hypothetical protein
MTRLAPVSRRDVLVIAAVGAGFTNACGRAAGQAHLTASRRTLDAALTPGGSEVQRCGCRELRRCEEHLPRAMPVMPLLFHGSAGLQKPYARGLGTNLFHVHPFKYAWIDTNWKPERN